MPGCIFCANRKTSKEHLWGKWWLKIYPPLKEDQTKRFGHDVKVNGENGEVGFEKGPFSNVGHPLSKTTKVICKRCNNTWCSKIEDRMKAAFIRIYRQSGPLDAKHIDAVRNWMFLKLCFHMRAHQPPAVGEFKVTADDYKKIWHKFGSSRTIPSDFRFFLSRGQDPMTYGTFNYIPFGARIEMSDGAAALDMNHTCMFEVGEFQGLVTNASFIADELSVANLSERQSPIVELVPGCALGPLVERAQFSKLEERVLRLIEARKKTVLRRTREVKIS